MERKSIQNVFIIGSKSIGQYGGYETFVDELTEYHQNEESIKYHIACKANGDGYMDESKLEDISDVVKDSEGNVTNFTYHNADVFKLRVPNIGPAVAIYYDLAALKYSINYCKQNSIAHPIFYILACRIGPFLKHYKRQIKDLDGKLFINPDGHEWKRAKWSAPIRKYWKLSERLMVKEADLVISDSINIEKYIKEEYERYRPNTTYIAYGCDFKPSELSDNDPKFVNWLKEKKLSVNNYYLVVGRFVPENNYETMIREFMESDTKKDFALVTNVNEKFLNQLEEKLQFKKDSRIKFVGTVYDKELLKKIRENAYAYLHGHEVGGTNPSLLEALGSTKLNLLLDVGFNREVAEDGAIYWSKEKDNLCQLISKVDGFDLKQIQDYSIKAIDRINNYYSWNYIANLYKNVFSMMEV